MNLTEIRTKKGMTQTELAEACGISQKMVSAIEVDRRRPSYEVLVRLANALECSIDDLVGDELQSMKEVTDDRA